MHRIILMVMDDFESNAEYEFRAYSNNAKLCGTAYLTGIDYMIFDHRKEQ